MKTDGRRSDALTAAAELAKAGSGDWVLIRSDVNVCHLTRLRQGRVVAFRPVSDWRFVSVRGDLPKNRCHIYAQYVPESTT